ncbi:MAG: hypothetical protein R3190_12150, partial [Thermoanaerobaculia bacterium]|nr:hypothetical protein [Thermoanaerobaculia bacterium]
MSSDPAREPATAVVLLAIFALILAAPVAAAEGWTLPRTPHGQPDFQGTWSNNTATPFERPEIFGDKAVL